MRCTRKRWTAVGLTACLLAVALMAPAVAATRQEIGLSEQEWEVLKRANQERMAKGLSPLSAFSTLQKAAHVRSNDLAVEYRSDHTRPDGTSCFSVLKPLGLSYRAVGENIAAGYQTPASVMDAWMNSSGHRANLLSQSFHHLGVGFGHETKQGYGTVWEQMFLDSDCTFSEMSVEPSTVVLGQNQALSDIDATVTIQCRVHGTSVMPLLSEMCQGGDTGTIQVRYQGLSTTLTVSRAPWSKANSWATGELNQAASVGLIPTCLEKTDFTATITRAEFAAVAVKLYEAMGGTLPQTQESPFTDTKDGAVIQAHALGIVSGVGGGRFAPGEPLTREQAAVMLAQTHKALGGTVNGGAEHFPDSAQISSWALESVRFMAGKGLIQGDHMGRFLPKYELTRESALLIAVRMEEKLA